MGGYVDFDQPAVTGTCDLVTGTSRSERLGAMRVMHLRNNVCAEPPTGAHLAAA
jgi:hypothetical protein